MKPEDVYALSVGDIVETDEGYFRVHGFEKGFIHPYVKLKRYAGFQSKNTPPPFPWGRYPDLGTIGIHDAWMYRIKRFVRKNIWSWGIRQRINLRQPVSLYVPYVIRQFNKQRTQ